MAVQLTEREYRLFREWLVEQFGLCFGPEKREILRSRLEPRRAELGFDTFEQLHFHLKFHPDRERQRELLIPRLTNNESYFFREPAQLEVLADEVLPELRERLERQGRREVRLLSAACASGEEPYTLAMVVRDSGVFPAGWKVRITGLDLDPQALERAREARFTRNAFRRTEPELRRRHFRELEPGVWQPEAELRELVQFRQANLVDPQWPSGLRPQDVVFCRNALIYFDDHSVRRAVDGLYRVLAPGGWLFLGHAESLSRVPTRLVAQRRPGAIFYCKPERGSE